MGDKVENMYVLVADKTSQILATDVDYVAIKRIAALIRKAGGECTIFRAVKG